MLTEGIECQTAVKEKRGRGKTDHEHAWNENNHSLQDKSTSTTVLCNHYSGCCLLYLAQADVLKSIECMSGMINTKYVESFYKTLSKARKTRDCQNDAN